MSQTIVDDDDAAVMYQPSWHPDPGAWNMVDRSRHGTPDQGATASLTFKGTGIEVIGTVQSSASDGYPTTTYAIDGDLIGTYTPPFVNNGDQLFNVSFFAKRDLTSGEHTIVITNTNGTSPNFFWLDYFLVDSASVPGIPDVPPPTTLQPTSTSTRTTSSTSDSSSPLQPKTSSTTTHTSSVSSDPSSLPGSTVETGTSVVTTFNGTSISQPTTTPSQSTTTSSLSRFSNGSSSSMSATTSISVLPTSSEVEARVPPGDLNLAAILGGVFGALALLVLLLLSCIWRKRRRHKVVQGSCQAALGTNTLLMVRSCDHGARTQLHLARSRQRRR
ncbi:hypothetical protein C8Q74DRAFT_292343 [Fomes fomentarius]|nr:hypothetical protein C8Q74DRAFT_292343 [Fomes fomentarius]